MDMLFPIVVAEVRTKIQRMNEEMRENFVSSLVSREREWIEPVNSKVPRQISSRNDR